MTIHTYLPITWWMHAEVLNMQCLEYMIFNLDIYYRHTKTDGQISYYMPVLNWIKAVEGNIENVPRNIQGEKSRKDKASSEKLVSTKNGPNVMW